MRFVFSVSPILQNRWMMTEILGMFESILQWDFDIFEFVEVKSIRHSIFETSFALLCHGWIGGEKAGGWGRHRARGGWTHSHFISTPLGIPQITASLIG